MDLLKNTLLNGVVYAVATIGSAVALYSGAHGLEYVCRPLMMVVLSSWFFFNSRRYGDRFTLLIQAGLFFSLIGDVAIMLQGRKDEFNFLIALGAYLLAQMCYLMAFLWNIIDVGGNGGWMLSSTIVLALGLGGVFFVPDLLAHVDDDLYTPVVVYTSVLWIMCSLAAFRYTRTFLRSFWVVLAGTLLFVVSAGLLGMARFVHPVDWAAPTSAVIYGAGQAFIAGGCLLHVLDPETIMRRKALEA